MLQCRLMFAEGHENLREEAVWATPQTNLLQRMCQVQYERHPSSALLPPLEEAYELQIWKFKFSHACILLHMCTDIAAL